MMMIKVLVYIQLYSQRHITRELQSCILLQYGMAISVCNPTFSNTQRLHCAMEIKTNMKKFVDLLVSTTSLVIL